MGLHGAVLQESRFEDPYVGIIDVEKEELARQAA